MPKNKHRKSAFAYFLEDYHNEQKAKGRKLSKKAASRECSYMWGALSACKRHRYCEMANPMKQRVNKRGEVQPVPENMEWLDPITGEYGEKWLRYVRAGDEMEYFRNNIVSMNATKELPHYIVHYNYFCRTGYKKYVPAEVAVLEFTLLDGITREFHRVINPGEIPIGYASEAKNAWKNVHGIEIPCLSRGEELPKVQADLLQFLKYSHGEPEKNSQIPPLFALSDNILPAMHMLNDMVEYTEDDPVFKLYPVHKLFYYMKNKAADICGRSAGFLGDADAEREIERDRFRFVVELACQYHQKNEGMYPACSLSIIRRLAHMICYRCCSLLGIQLVAGMHVHGSYIKYLSQDGDDSDNPDPKGAKGGDKSKPPSGDAKNETDSYEYKQMHKWVNQSFQRMIKLFDNVDPFEEEETYDYYLNNPELDEKPGEHRHYVRLTPIVEGEDESFYQPTPEEQVAALRRDRNREIRDGILARKRERDVLKAIEAFKLNAMSGTLWREGPYGGGATGYAECSEG